MPAALRLFTLCLTLSVLPVASGWAQDETPAAEPSMQDVLNSLEQEPAEHTAHPTAPAPANTATDIPAEEPVVVPPSAQTAPADNSYIVPPAGQSAANTPVGENSSIVPAQPLENMNPALMPATPADEAPKAVRAETPPAPPKPPAYDPQPYVILQTLDKVTARTNTMTVKVGDTVAIGPLFVQVKICQQAAPLETPDSAAFLEIWEAKPKDVAPVSRDDGPSQWVFSGWMFASSPALSAMDHPIYDIWVLNCKKSATDVTEKSDEVKPAESPATAIPSAASKTD